MPMGPKKPGWCCCMGWWAHGGIIGGGGPGGVIEPAFGTGLEGCWNGTHGSGLL